MTQLMKRVFIKYQNDMIVFIVIADTKLSRPDVMQRGGMHAFILRALNINVGVNLILQGINKSRNSIMVITTDFVLWKS